MKIFNICTIANNLNQYQKMKESFFDSGFNELSCRYTLFDNSNGNIYEPYSTFNQIQKSTIEPYIIFCHQDILLNQGHGFEQLVKVIEELNSLDPKWAILGNAGFNNSYEQVVRINDPNNLKQWDKDFPQKVHSLDENFLVIKTCTNITCSSEIKGFHFYATDLCLKSLTKGYSCYVVDFYLTHLSRGKFDQSFWDLQKKLKERWNREFNFLYIKATGVPMFISKHTALNNVLGRDRLIRLFLSIKLHKLMSLTISLKRGN